MLEESLTERETDFTRRPKLNLDYAKSKNGRMLEYVSGNAVKKVIKTRGRFTEWS